MKSGHWEETSLHKVTVEEAATKLPALIQEAIQGAEVIITRKSGLLPNW